MKEVADNNCVYRNEIHHSIRERTQVLEDVAADPTLHHHSPFPLVAGSAARILILQSILLSQRTADAIQSADPTLPRTKSFRCPNCGHEEAVFFQATARGEEGMTLFFVCCNPNSGHRWRD